MEQAAVTASPPVRLSARTLVGALRPGEWVKNTFVFAAVLFSGQFDFHSALRSAGAFAAFCAVASAGYLVNDIHDVEVDRRHPVKRDRAIASGSLPIPTARTVAVGLALAGLALAAVVSLGLLGIVAAYGVTTVAYSFLL